MLRSKGNSYKRRRQELQDMTAEAQLLKRTEEILKEQVEQIKGRMVRRASRFSLERRRSFVFRAWRNANRASKDIFRPKNGWKNCPPWRWNRTNWKAKRSMKSRVWSKRWTIESRRKRPNSIHCWKKSNRYERRSKWKENMFEAPEKFFRLGIGGRIQREKGQVQRVERQFREQSVDSRSGSSSLAEREFLVLIFYFLCRTFVAFTMSNTRKRRVSIRFVRSYCWMPFNWNVLMMKQVHMYRKTKHPNHIGRSRLIFSPQMFICLFTLIENNWINRLVTAKCVSSRTGRNKNRPKTFKSTEQNNWNTGAISFEWWNWNDAWPRWVERTLVLTCLSFSSRANRECRTVGSTFCVLSCWLNIEGRIKRREKDDCAQLSAGMSIDDQDKRNTTMPRKSQPHWHPEPKKRAEKKRRRATLTNMFINPRKERREGKEISSLVYPICSLFASQ